MKRKFNGECDELAGRGKKINDTKMFVDTFESDGKYWKGAWDGGYDPGFEFSWALASKCGQPMWRSSLVILWCRVIGR